MKTIKYLILSVIFLFCPLKSLSQDIVDTSSFGPPTQDPTIENFKDSLSDKGEWIKVNQDDIDNSDMTTVDTVYIEKDVDIEYIWVPSPSIVWVDWNPYSYGHWVLTSWGWEWVPYYDWGWSTYHYGRWWYSDYYGWCWSPGYRWRCHWVSWRHEGNYWGWHPLSPRVHIKNGKHIMNTNEKSWTYVDKKDFTKPIDKTKIDIRTKTVEKKQVSIDNSNKVYKSNNSTTTKPNINYKKQNNNTSEPKQKVIIHNENKGSNTTKHNNSPSSSPKGNHNSKNTTKSKN